MNKRALHFWPCLAMAFVLLILLTAGATTAATQPATPEMHQAQALHEALAIRFEENSGQFDKSVLFKASRDDMEAFFTSRGVVFRIPGSAESGRVLRLTPLGMNDNVRMRGLDPLPGRVSRFIGNDPTRWGRGAKTFDAVLYENAYPGVDIQFYFRDRLLEYDLLCDAGVDPASVRFAVEGAEKAVVNDKGDLEFHAQGRVWLTQHRPVGFQTREGKEFVIPGDFELLEAQDRHVYRLAMAEHDAGAPLRVDPVLGFSTYFGASTSHWVNDVAVGPQGNVFVVGETSGSASDIPVTVGSAYQSNSDPAEEYSAVVELIQGASLAAMYKATPCPTMPLDRRTSARSAYEVYMPVISRSGGTSMAGVTLMLSD